MATAGKKPLAELFSDFSLHADVPKRIGVGWDSLLIRLGLTSVDLQHIDHDNKLLKDKIKDGLFRWNTEKKQKPVSKRAADFLEALRAEGMVPLVEELEAEYDFDEPELVENTPGDMEDSSDKFADKRVIYTREVLGDSIMSSLDPPTNDDPEYPYKKGRPGPPLPPVAGLGTGPTRTPMIVDTVPVRAAPPTTGGVQVSDIEMVDTNQNIPPTENGIPDSHLMSISVELAKEPRWRALCSELDINIEELDELTSTSDTTNGKIYLLLSYWREAIVQNSPNAGRLLYLAMYKANFQLLALQLATKNLFPGVVIEPFPVTPDNNTETRMEELPNPQTQPIPTAAPGAESTNENQPPVANIPPQVPQTNQRQDAISSENIVINSEEARPSMVGPPNPPPANQQVGVQRSSNTDDGRMSGAAPLPRPAVNETEQQKQDNELIRQIQRVNMDNELDLPSYKMDAKPRGVCVIINNEKFYKVPGDDGSKEMPDRIGTHRDAGRLTTVFRKLDFRVETYNNCTDSEMARLLSEVGYRNHAEFDCFVCCILTHGATGHVFGSNGKMVRIEILTGFFRAQYCPTLAGKPKLFFIQACQGREKQRGYDIEADAAVMPANRPERPDLAVDISGREMIPDEADFILGYATVPGYVSYRSRSQGSWFINKLVDMLDKYAYRYDLLSVLVKVNEEVGNAIANVDGGQYKQIPAPLVTLRKKLYFR